MKNEASHRKARKEAGLTSCSNCKDRGHVTYYQGAGGGRIGCRTMSAKCSACKCYFCGNDATEENGICVECRELRDSDKDIVSLFKYPGFQSFI